MRRKRKTWTVVLCLTSIGILTSMPLLSSNVFSEADSGTFTDPRDEQTYRWVRVGDQVWMAENLRYLPKIHSPKQGCLEWYHYYVYAYKGYDINAAKTTDNYQNYGVLYNWASAMDGAYTSNSNPSAVQGICPPGWHVPSHAEWTQLIKHVESEGYFNSNWEMGSGNMLKSCNQIDSALGGTCNTAKQPRWDYHNIHNGLDEYGFAALPGGEKLYNNFIDLGRHGYWWSSTDYSLSEAWVINISYNNGGVRRLVKDKSNGISLRCVQN